MPMRDPNAEHKYTRVGFVDADDGLVKSDITDSKSDDGDDEESVLEFGIDEEAGMKEKFTFAGEKYGEPTTCLDYSKC
jgi:hypothetical protein